MENQIFDLLFNIEELLKAYMNYCDAKRKFSKKSRRPNFPEEVSENLVKCILYIKFDINSEWKIGGGDLRENGNKLEVKCFSSTGPTSFGPSESWECIYFLDATKYLENKFILYKVALRNDSHEWMNLKINNKKETYADQCAQKRRPRIGFKKIYEQLENHIEIIFSGSIKDLY